MQQKWPHCLSLARISINHRGASLGQTGYYTNYSYAMSHQVHVIAVVATFRLLTVFKKLDPRAAADEERLLLCRKLAFRPRILIHFEQVLTKVR